MKKVVRYLYLMIIVFTILPLNIFADCGISFINLKMKISNKDGAKIYESKNIDNKESYVSTGEIIKYGEEVNVLHEYKGYALIEYKGNNNLYINTSDYTYSGEKDNKNNNYVKYYAYIDTIIRNVPSFYSYEIVETIPANTYFEVSGANDGFYNYINHEGEWAFASYNGKTGWVHVGECMLQDQAITILNKYDKPLEVHVLGEGNSYNGIMEGYSILGDNNTKKELNLKRGEKIEIIGDYKVGHDTNYYVKTNTIDGIWVTGTFYKEVNDTVIAILNADDLTIKEFNTLKKNDIKLSNYKIYDCPYEILSSYEKMFQDYIVRIDNIDYLLSENENKSCSILKNKKTNLIVNGDSLYYKYPQNIDDYKLGSLPEGNYQGYKVLNEEKYYFIPDYGFIEYIDSNLSQEMEDNSQETNNKNKSNVIIEKDTVPETTYVMYCIIGTLIVSFVAGGVIILINKKNKEKNNS